MTRRPTVSAVFALAFAAAGLVACGTRAADDLSASGDEFNNAGTLGSWRQVYQDEGWGANQLERFDIGRSQAGWLTMMPFTSTWYRDHRGVLAYKPIQGDFVVTTRVRVNRRGGDGPPRSQYSLAGIMVRTPRSITPQTWRPGGENYVFLSLGAADTPGRYQFEVKTTVNSDSQLRTAPADGGEAVIQVARVGPHIVTLKKPAGGGWSVHQRYYRPDLPGTLQVGLTCYTDWPTAGKLGAQQHNATVIRNGNPDLVALFDYVRYHRPAVPGSLQGKPLADPRAVSDGDLLRFLGEALAGE